jgi:hypothetical protein
MSEIHVQPPKSIPPILCVKCGQQARLIRRMPVNPFDLEEKHLFECVDPNCGFQMELAGRG